MKLKNIKIKNYRCFKEANIDFDEHVTLIVGKNGAVTVCAAGNESYDNDTGESYPVDIDSPYLLSVAASNEKNELNLRSVFADKNIFYFSPF